jgi:hypothetical protein
VQQPISLLSPLRIGTVGKEMPEHSLKLASLSRIGDKQPEDSNSCPFQHLPDP